MDLNAEETDDLKPNDNLEPEDAPEPDADAADGNDGDQGEGGEDGEPGDGQGDDSEEVEIVREGDTQPQKSTPKGFLKRISKLNGKVDVAHQETDAAKNEAAEERRRAEFAEEKNRVLELALEQKNAGTGTQEEKTYPNPDDFGGGVYDAEYIRQLDEYQNYRIQEGIKKGLAAVTEKSTVIQANTAQQLALEKAQIAHCERATKLGIKDYEETEDKALKIFGVSNTNHLIKAMPENSEVAMYYFGKNPKVAERFAEMLKDDPIRGLLEIGTHLAGVKVKKGGKSKILPDPDLELEGGQTGTPKKSRGPKGATFT